MLRDKVESPKTFTLATGCRLILTQMPIMPSGSAKVPIQLRNDENDDNNDEKSNPIQLIALKYII